MAKTGAAADDFGYSKLSIQELNKVIADMTASNHKLKDDKKAYTDSTNEVIKENEKRIKVALESRKLAIQAAADTTHEQTVGEFLKTATG